jgi:SAM-dependent methyltransferase
MKLRESGMPEDVAYWESLFDPVQFLHTVGFDVGLETAVDFGCGYGTFTLPLARGARGRVYAVDLEPGMLQIVQKRAVQQRINNIITLQRDLLLEGCGLADESVDGVLLAHLLHGEPVENVRLLQETQRILRVGGRVAIIHWRRDVPTPRGPTLGFRPTPEQCSDWCIQAGFDKDSQEKHTLGLYHWGIVMRK